MVSQTLGNNNLPTILVVQDSQTKIGSDSAILSQFNIVYISQSNNLDTLFWIQENQPNSILLDFKHPNSACLNLITSLRLDWLTRNIPIVVMTNRFALQSITHLDCDGYLVTPYSITELEKTICHFIRTPICNIHAV